MKSVVICGSARFADGIRAFAKKLKDFGADVYEPHLYRASKEGDWDAIKGFDRKFVAMGLVHDHFYKIRMADTVFIYNQDGYSGNNTNIEIGFAAALNKPIYALSGQDDDICRRVIFRSVAATPEELIDILKK